MVETSTVIERVVECLGELRRGLDRATLNVDDEGAAYAWWALPVLCRGVFLCEAAVTLIASPERAAATTLLRPAIECWIDACYVMYCGPEAVLKVGGVSLAKRETMARLWMGQLPENLVAEREQLDEVVDLGREASVVSDQFAVTKEFPVEQRLREAISCKKASSHYMVAYDVFYRALSFSELHPAGAIETNLTLDEHTATFRVTSSDLFGVESVLAVVTGWLCEAGRDAFALLNQDTARLEECRKALEIELLPLIRQLIEQLASDDPSDPDASSEQRDG